MSWKKNIDNLIKIHKEGSELFDKSDGQVLYEYATGSGKSKQAIDNIAKDSDYWLILCAETAHINNWLEEFKKWDMEHLLKRTQLICYASVANYFSTVGKDYKINIVADEAHHMFSPTYYPVVVQHAAKLQMLTATLPMESKARMQMSPRLSIIQKKVLSLTQAIRLDILPTPGIFIVPASFDSYNRNIEVTITKGARAKWEKMAPVYVNYNEFRRYMKQTPLHLIVRCTESEAMSYHNGQCDYYKQMYFSQRQPYQENQMKLAGSRRKRFIANIKTTMAKQFIEQYVDKKRAIIFCGSIEQADELGGDLAIHSKVSKKIQNERIKAFQDRKVDRIYTNRMLREGMNLESIEVAVVIQLDNKNLAFVQMAGRAMRSNFPELFIFNAPNTQDDKYLENSLVGIPREFIKTISEYGVKSEPITAENITNFSIGM